MMLIKEGKEERWKGKGNKGSIVAPFFICRRYVLRPLVDAWNHG